MAKISRFVLFWRAFLISLLVGVPSGTGKSAASDNSDWNRAKKVGTCEGFVQYLRRNPTGQYINEAIDKILALKGCSLASSKKTRSVDLY